jgi:hypothetical protein
MTRKPVEIPNVEVAPSYLTNTIAALLDYIIKENAKCESPANPDCLFSTAWKYDWVEIGDYIDRLKEWIVCGTESFVVAVCYFKRLEAQGMLPVINTLSVHRIFFTCLMLAVKMVEDETLNNADFAKVACIQLKDLNSMEVFVLRCLNFECSVPVEEFITVKRDLIHLDLLLTKAKSGKVQELAKLGRSQESKTGLCISSISNDLAGITAKRYFANALPLLKEKRRNSAICPTAVAESSTPLAMKGAVPNYIPSFMKRRISFEAFRSKTVTPQVVEAKPATPTVLFRQDSA